MDRFIDRIFDTSTELARHLFGPTGKRPDEVLPLVVVDADELRGASFIDHLLICPPSPVDCSPGPRRVFVELDDRLNCFELFRPDFYGWLFEGCDPRPAVFERVRATLVVEQNGLIIGPEAIIDIDLDGDGRVVGWPDRPSPGWSTPSSAGRVIGGASFIHLIHPALAALEQLNAEGDSIQLRARYPGPGQGRSKRGMSPLFPYLIPSSRLY